MVSGARHLEQTSNPSCDNYEDNDKCECDDVSVSSSLDDSDGAIVLSQAEESKSPCFQNIEVTNSNDVHFGNKTYYQGPVTIKQILYATPSGDHSNGIENLAIKDTCVIDKTVSNGKDNLGFATDSVPHTNGYVNNNDKNSVPSGVDKGTKWLKHFSRRKYILAISMAILLLVALVCLGTILLTKHIPNVPRNPLLVDSDEQDTSAPEAEPNDPKVNLTLSGKLKIIPRRAWLAQPPTQEANFLHHPVPYVIIMHTASEQCKDQPDCVFAVRHIQMFHIESNGWWDIGYNFLVGGDGCAYEGRGWKYEGAHTYGYNAKSIGIAFIGTFTSVRPKERQILAAKQLIEQGLEKGIIDKNYKLLAARQVSSTKSPGLVLYEDVKTWPHWSASP